jgi:HSP20 family protein
MSATTDVDQKATESATPMEQPASQVARRTPGDLFASMQAEIDRAFGRHWPFFERLRRPGELSTAWSPRVDVFERDGGLVVKAELPGVTKDAVTVTVDDGDLVIRGERKAEEKVEEKDYYRMERSFGTFYRRLPLPQGVTADQITATFSDGVLEVSVPKPATPETASTQIPIK